MTDTLRPGQHEPQTPTREGDGELVPLSLETSEDPVSNAGSSTIVRDNELPEYPGVAAAETARKPWYKRTAIRVGAGVATAAAVVGGAITAARGGGETTTESRKEPTELGLPGQPNTPSSVSTPEKPPVASNDPHKTPFGQEIQYGADPSGQNLGNYIYPKELRNEDKLTATEKEAIDFYTKNLLPSRAEEIKTGRKMSFKPELCIAWDQKYEPKGNAPTTITKLYSSPEHRQSGNFDFYTFTSSTGSGETIAIEKGQTGLTRKALFPATKAAMDVRMVGDESVELQATIIGALKDRNGPYEGRGGAPLFMGDIKQQNPEIQWQKTGELVGKNIARPFIAGGVTVIIGQVPDDQLQAICNDLVSKSGYQAA